MSVCGHGECFYGCATANTNRSFSGSCVPLSTSKQMRPNILLSFTVKVEEGLDYRAGGGGGGGRSGCAAGVDAEVRPSVVKVLGHVGEGFVAELALVKGVGGVRLPARRTREGRR